MQLTRKRIIAAAIDLIERDGIEAVSMDRLATELGCGVMSLYSHVPSTSALLDGVADAVMSGIAIPSAEACSWQDQIRAQARAFRQTAMAHPRCTMLAVRRPSASASMMRPVEYALATLCGAGVGGQDAVRIVRAVSAYVMGSLLGEISVTPDRADYDDETRRLRLRPGEFPHVTAVAAELSARNPDADFEFGLGLLVCAVAAMPPARAAASQPTAKAG